MVVLDAAKQCHNGLEEALQSGCDAHTFFIVCADEPGLVDVDADDLAAGLLSCFAGGCIDAAAAGEDDFGAICIPCVHSRRNVSIAVELVAVCVVEFHITETQFFRCIVSALYVAVAKTHNARNRHAAEEAKLPEAELDSRITSHIAGQLFAVSCAVDVLSCVAGLSGSCVEVILGDVESDELQIRIHIRLFDNRFRK